jgi:hypothetical protein
MRLSLQAIARPECRLPFVNSPTLFLEKHRRIAAMNICTIVHSVVPWPARSLRALAISPAGILIGFGPENSFCSMWSPDVSPGTIGLEWNLPPEFCG